MPTSSRHAAPPPAPADVPAGDGSGGGRAPRHVLALPIAAALALLAEALWPPIREDPRTLAAFIGAAGTLALWTGWLHVAARRAGRRLVLQRAIHKHHWVQALAQLAVLTYLALHLRYLFGYFPLIAAQLLFAYGVDSLLTWSRRDAYRLGFGPFPVVLSINLFLWFRPEWFHWQFAMVLVGYLAKEFIRWNRDGRSAHIFNPSSFPLAVFSLALLLTGTTGLTFGPELATAYSRPPNIYLVIFLAALPGQILFGVARMTLAAAVTMYLIATAYFEATGLHLFFDTAIPVPVFLGMHLLLTDPSTSPRSELGRLGFGALYAIGTFGFYLLLSAVGAPTFFDKLLPLPLMNLMVRRIDRLAASKPLAWLDPGRLGRGASRLGRNVAYTALWAAAFVGLSGAQAIGDRHPGQALPLWDRACAEGSARACGYALLRKATFCANRSGWGCNAWGIQLRRSGRPADRAFARGCELGFDPACENVGRTGVPADALARARPTLADLPIVLSGKIPVRARDPEALYAIACEQGWPGTCEGPP
ncbi:MAG: hypothetical protein KY466_12395 [Gemmatimonadetes bacterium]|nr:hypothetical protein [Gemmatimonadota bacterium]